MWGCLQTLRSSNLSSWARCLFFSLLWDICTWSQIIYCELSRPETPDGMVLWEKAIPFWGIFRWLRWYQRLWYVESIFTPARYMEMYLRDKCPAQWIRTQWAVVSATLVCYQHAGTNEIVYSHIGITTSTLSWSAIWHTCPLLRLLILLVLSSWSYVEADGIPILSLCWLVRWISHLCTRFA
jgi:hypothetical protein